MSALRVRRIAGVDEAGRGPLAGPVVVAAVILDPRRPIDGLADSKVLSEAQRDELAPLIRAHALAWSVVAVDIDEIERLNILGATLIGMERALRALQTAPVLALIDGNRLPKNLPCRARAIVDGDATEPAIGAASILAKTERDRIMRELDDAHPGYGFARHKGYSTPEHLVALERLGPCAIHRRGFEPVRRLLEPELF
ncbi:ribonuclease HII [Dokdonella fugitiva]|uniref:Ribonuclease HII n=1 Tax=Dokdonella fugitiva TaxID=328517 RepID=A0A839F756_9GAMM|nr:ribonuclease HII [Dokdonella fugitiva]MBA8889378.1 ribonuclease HII [Dokdonella fugitiva]